MIVNVLVCGAFQPHTQESELSFCAKAGIENPLKSPQLFLMDEPVRRYPDISKIVARKASGRQRQAALTFSAKLDILDAMRARVETLVRAREDRAAKTRPV